MEERVLTQNEHERAVKLLNELKSQRIITKESATAPVTPERKVIATKTPAREVIEKKAKEPAASSPIRYFVTAKKKTETSTPVISRNRSPSTSVKRTSKKSKQAGFTTRFSKKPAATCSQCSQEIKGASVDYNDAQWHEQCFICKKCGDPLQEGNFLEKDKEFTCFRCVAAFPNICICCEQLVIGTVVIGKNNTWQLDHFRCGNCRNALKEHYYDVKGS